MSGADKKPSRAEIIIDELQSFIDNYRGLALPNENVSMGLHSIRKVYDADIAFILMLDPDFNEFCVIAAEFREGLDRYAELPARKTIAKNLFHGLVRQDEQVCITAEELKDVHPAEYKWMDAKGIRGFMLRPILTRAAMKAFIGVCNAGRMFGDYSMLTFSTFMLTNEIRSLTILDRFARRSIPSVILEDHDIVVNMFGGFELWTRKGMLDFGGTTSTKCALLLTYLIFNKDRVVPVRELAEILWPDQLFDNPYNMIKGVVFRLKKSLDPISEKKIIVPRQRTYMINDEITLHQDTYTFEMTCRSLKQSNLTAKERLLLFERAISCYRGNLLPSFEDELWLVGKINYYQIMYSAVVRDYLLFLDRQGNVEDFFSVVSKVLNILYPDGDIYNLILSVLVEHKRIDIARNCYLKVEKLLSPEQKQRFLHLWNK